MKGSNKIELNQATMCAAVQHYFETVVFQPAACPKVEAVDSVDRTQGTFWVKVVEPETEIRREPWVHPGTLV